MKGWAPFFIKTFSDPIFFHPARLQGRIEVLSYGLLEVVLELCEEHRVILLSNQLPVLEKIF